MRRIFFLFTAALALFSAPAYALQNNQLNATGDVLICSGRPWIDVKCYGATGDGSHDDTTAINAAVSDAINGNFPVHFPQGTFKATAPLVWDYAGIAGNGLQIVSEGAVIDGRTITSGSPLQIACSGGVPGAPAVCQHLQIKGRLKVWANIADYGAKIGKSDFSDLHSGAHADGFVVQNDSTNAAAGGVQLNYLTEPDLWIDAQTSGGNSSHAGVAIEQVQRGRIAGRGSAVGANAPSVLFETGRSFGNTLAAFNYGASPTCIRVSGNATASANVVVAPYYDCTNALDAQPGQGNAILQVAPTYAGSTAGPQSAGAATLGRGNLSRYAEPAVSSYTAAGTDDGLILSSKNASGPLAGWAAASLPVTLPSPAAVGPGWTIAFVTDNNKAVTAIVAGAAIIAGGKSSSSITLGPGNYEFAQLVSDGANYRVTAITPNSLTANGIAGAYPTRWSFPGGPGYAATQSDGGSWISSAIVGGNLALTLPAPGAVPSGWTVGVTGDTYGSTVGVSGGGNHIVLPGGQLASSFSVAAGDSVVFQSDGANFRITQSSLFTAYAPFSPEVHQGQGCQPTFGHYIQWGDCAMKVQGGHFWLNDPDASLYAAAVIESPHIGDELGLDWTIDGNTFAVRSTATTTNAHTEALALCNAILAKTDLMAALLAHHGADGKGYAPLQTGCPNQTVGGAILFNYPWGSGNSNHVDGVDGASNSRVTVCSALYPCNYAGRGTTNVVPALDGAPNVVLTHAITGYTPTKGAQGANLVWQGFDGFNQIGAIYPVYEGDNSTTFGASLRFNSLGDSGVPSTKMAIKNGVYAWYDGAEGICPGDKGLGSFSACTMYALQYFIGSDSGATLAKGGSQETLIQAQATKNLVLGGYSFQSSLTITPTQIQTGYPFVFAALGPITAGPSLGATNNKQYLVGGTGGVCFASQDTSADTFCVDNSGNPVFKNTPTYASSTTGASTPTYNNSPCAGGTVRWIPAAITGQTGTWYVPACK